MEKTLQDYAHFYVGQNVLRPDGKTILPIYGVQNSLIIHRENNELTYSGMDGCKLILKSLSAITSEISKQMRAETNDIPRDENSHLVMDAVRTAYLIKNGFDVFGLIAKGIALDESKVNIYNAQIYR